MYNPENRKISRRDFITLGVVVSQVISCGRKETGSVGDGENINKTNPAVPVTSVADPKLPQDRAGVEKKSPERSVKEMVGEMGNKVIFLDRSTPSSADKANSMEVALKSLTVAYSGAPENGYIYKLRRLSFSDKTSEALYERYLKNPETLTYPMPTHPAVLVEFGFTEYLAKMAKSKRRQYLEACAEAMVDGYEEAYKNNIGRPMVVALEAGHMSTPLVIKDAQGKEVKISNGDARPRVALLEGGTISERDLTLELAQLIALKLMDRRPEWIPVLNSDEKGYPVKQLFQRELSGTIEPADAIFPMKYKWDQLALHLKKAGVGMTRVAIHFDAGTHNRGRDGMIITPADDDKNKTCENLANVLAPRIQQRVRSIIPDYEIKVNTDYDKNPNLGPLATLRYSTPSVPVSNKK